ncbi:MAG: retron system putative HNH endonuclease [Halorhodospira sp.]
MRHVIKQGEPASFCHWKAQASADWEPTWADLRAPEKPELHQALLQEQGYTCCYCGRAISAEGSHIEHFRPRSGECGYPHLSLSYRNLLASCQRNEGQGVPLVCGRAKGGWFDEGSHVDPQDPDCEQRFSYGSQGPIRPAADGDAPASTMIEKLKLNADILVETRKEVLAGAFTDEDLMADDEVLLREIAQCYAQRGADGQLPSMGHVVRRWAEDHLGLSL